jgi:hypothetical protein
MISHDIFVGPFCVHDVHELMIQLYRAKDTDQSIKLVCLEEAPCLETIGLYKILDKFCEKNNFEKSKIIISTGNLLEQHSNYTIINDLSYWFEIDALKKHLSVFERVQDYSQVTTHFGNFVGRSSWSRLWIGSHLFQHCADKTLQTFHSGPQRNYYTSDDSGIFDVIGLEDLNNNCFKQWQQLGNFLQSCPLTLDDSVAEQVIFYPENLGITNQYTKIFLDIVTECYVDGNTFALTEKTWRAVLCKRPFILMSTFNSLDNFKKLGFKTFSNWWSEDYDDASGADRVNMILKVIDEVATWPIEKCTDILDQMQETLDHNYLVFQSLTTDDLKKIK